jgi:single-stranded-DNA-specific exonuclease
MPKTRWTVTEACNTSTIQEICQRLGCPAPVAALLTARGVTSADNLRRFFHPLLDDLHDPAKLRGMTAAVARIQAAVAGGEPILIYGDYDVDGTIATVLLKTAIERTAAPARPAQVTFHVPHRLREGYGMQISRLAEAAAAGVRLVISVDTGIRAFAAAEEARALGLDLIVTDHHLPDGVQGMPDAVAVINPAQPGCTYPCKHLCGAAVAFKLAHALLRAHACTPEQTRRLDEVILPSFLKLLAIATVADSVELTGENRTIVTLGLRGLANPVQPGLRALMQVAEIPLDRAPTATEVGFRLGPRINAAGRMDVASDVVELFLTRDQTRANELARKLDRLNQERRASEASALDAIDLQLATLRDAAGDYAPECLVLDHPEWHRGVIGILASRVVERTGRPALVMQSGVADNADADSPTHAHGSGRSIAGFHLLAALEAAHAMSGDALFTRFGGHAHAVGFTLPTSRLNLLRENLRTHAASHLPAELLIPELRCDLALDACSLTPGLFAWVERCAPFGQGNPEPLFLIRGLRLSGTPRIIKERHICLPLGVLPGGRTLNGMGWTRAAPDELSWAERTADFTAGTTLDAVCRLRDNPHAQYGGFELELVDLRPADASASRKSLAGETEPAQ